LAQKARQKASDNPNFADTLGWAFYQKQIYKSAIPLFKEAASKDPENVDYHYHLGLAYAKDGQTNSGKIAKSAKQLGVQQMDQLSKIKLQDPEKSASRQKMVDDLKLELAQIKLQD